jgi:hypothetical protein
VKKGKVFTKDKACTDTLTFLREVFLVTVFSSSFGNIYNSFSNIIRLAQDRDQWWAVVNALMNLWVLVPQSE